MNEIKIYTPYVFLGDVKNAEEVQQYIVDANRFYQNKIKSRLKFRGKAVSFGDHRLENGLYQQFIHISGFLEKDDNFFVPRPCKDEKYISNCNNCVNRKIINRINAEERFFCFYRCSYMVYIINILKMINIGKTDNIDIYEEEKFDNKKMTKRKMIHIRYKYENVYYYILLEDTSEKGYYSFICGYPVFNEKIKREKNKIFGKIKKEEV